MGRALFVIVLFLFSCRQKAHESNTAEHKRVLDSIYAAQHISDSIIAANAGLDTYDSKHHGDELMLSEDDLMQMNKNIGIFNRGIGKSKIIINGKSGLRGLPDDTYPATVIYQNPATDEIHSYTLNVDVKKGRVVQFSFPFGGWIEEKSLDPLAPEGGDKSGSHSMMGAASQDADDEEDK